LDGQRSSCRLARLAHIQLGERLPGGEAHQQLEITVEEPPFLKGVFSVSQCCALVCVYVFAMNSKISKLLRDHSPVQYGSVWRAVVSPRWHSRVPICGIPPRLDAGPISSDASHLFLGQHSTQPSSILFTYAAPVQ